VPLGSELCGVVGPLSLRNLGGIRLEQRLLGIPGEFSPARASASRGRSLRLGRRRPAVASRRRASNPKVNGLPSFDRSLLDSGAPPELNRHREIRAQSRHRTELLLRGGRMRRANHALQLPAAGFCSAGLGAGVQRSGRRRRTVRRAVLGGSRAAAAERTYVSPRARSNFSSRGRRSGHEGRAARQCALRRGRAALVSQSWWHPFGAKAARNPWRVLSRSSACVQWPVTSPGPAAPGRRFTKKGVESQGQRPSQLREVPSRFAGAAGAGSAPRDPRAESSPHGGPSARW